MLPRSEAMQAWGATWTMSRAMSLQAHRPHYSGAIAPERMPLLVLVVVVRLTWPHPVHVAGREDDRQRQQRTGQRGAETLYRPYTAPT